MGTGDWMRFTKSDRERGYVANSVWTVTAVSGDSVTLSDGQQTRVIPRSGAGEQHGIDRPMPSPPTVRRGRVKPCHRRLKARKVTETDGRL
ncbi:hypothetical protein OIU92_32400 [Escherichia coli]|nr:hypothetical protein [Escherichia coli]